MGTWFYVISGVWAVAVVALLIDAARICYRIEERSGRPMLGRSGLPGYANVIPSAFNIGVARDAETQALRQRMNLRLLAIIGGFVAFGLFVLLTRPGGTSV